MQSTERGNVGKTSKEEAKGQKIVGVTTQQISCKQRRQYNFWLKVGELAREI